MARRCNFTFGDPDSYADAIEKAAVKLTITGAGDFSAQLVRLELKQLVIYRLRERLPRIAYISLPSDKIFVSFPAGPGSLVLDGFVLRRGDIVFHSPGHHVLRRRVPMGPDLAVTRSAGSLQQSPDRKANRNSGGEQDT